MHLLMLEEKTKYYYFIVLNVEREFFCCTPGQLNIFSIQRIRQLLQSIK